MCIIQMENRIKKPQTASLSRSRSSQRLKFKEITPSSQEFNQLNSKYELYRNGTPNVYSQDIEAIKAKNIKGEVGMLDLPAIDYIINQMAHTDKEKQINQRNYELYPSLLKIGNGRYKDMLSEKQQVKDFIIWFQTQYQNIEKSQEPLTKKFQDKQTLIAAGFNEMAAQVAKITKNRAQILRMLWNRQHSEVAVIIETLNGQGIKKEKSLLEQISLIHRQYQDQIEQLKRSNKQLEEKYGQQKVFSRACVNDLRVLRKRIKKLEYVSRKLGETNNGMKQENLHLMQENIKLLSSIKDISQEEAVILNYRKLQLYNLRRNSKKHNYKELMKLTQLMPEESLTPLQDLEQKKSSLYQYFLERVKENPGQKMLIKDQYFLDEDENRSAIDQYFKNVINRPTVQIQLLNETQEFKGTKERGVNTEEIEEQTAASPLTFEKGIQAEVKEQWWNRSGHSSWDHHEGQKSERRLYHIMDQKEDEHKEKESKMRIIQHRISRKNSLTLLQLQNIQDVNNKLLEKKAAPLSLFAKKGITSNNLGLSGGSNSIKEDQLQQSQSVVCEEKSSIQSDVSSQSEGLLNDIAQNSELMAINMGYPNAIGVRKSINFKEMLKSFSEDCQNESLAAEEDKQMMIHLDGDEKQAIRQGQLQDLIEKHLAKNPTGSSSSPEKSLSKMLLALFKNVWRQTGINLKFEMLQVIKQNYGNGKSVIWKFLSAVSIVKQNQSNPLLKVLSVLLKINHKYALYNCVNTQEVADIYFHLFTQLSIKNINDYGFNIWKACTTLDKIRTVDFMEVVEQFFSDKKRRYIQGKITELLAASQHEMKVKKINNYSSNKRIQVVSEDLSIIKLNPLLLYIVEVYLIQKQLYYSSYCQMAAFLSSNDIIPVQVFLWLLELYGFSQEKQKSIIEFALPYHGEQKRQSRYSQTGQNKEAKHLKTDMLYRCCVKFDFPIMEELSVSTYSQFRLLPIEIQQKYYRMIGMDEWMQIKEILEDRYQQTCESPIYLKAFVMIANRLEGEIKKGTSIYGQSAEEEKIKRKEEVFSLFYKILIVEAHRSLIEQQVTRAVQKRAMA